MTCVEFLGKAPAENIYASLCCLPDRVIFADSDEAQLKRETEKYRSFFEKRGEKIEFLSCLMPHDDFEKTVDAISSLVTKYDDCVFDVYGGNELLFVALGVVYERFKEKNIRINTVNYQHLGGCAGHEPQLSVEEYIQLGGGTVLYEKESDSRELCRKITDDFDKDIDRLYYFCRSYSTLWNTLSGVLGTLEKVGDVSESGLSVYVSPKAYGAMSSEKRAIFKKSERLLWRMRREGLFSWLETDTQTGIRFTYKNSAIKKCLSKAGQVLELKIFKTVKELTDGGEAVCNDVQTGVVIDWDGVTLDELSDKWGTRNEIDVFAMSGMVPVFISCKNGAVDTEELYKLNTVASRFGGGQGKMILVVTSLLQKGEKSKYFRQRMKDMGIHLIENLKSCNDEELKHRLKKIILSRG